MSIAVCINSSQKSKGVNCEVEFKGRWRQTFEPTFGKANNGVTGEFNLSRQMAAHVPPKLAEQIID